jgi:MoxR-like ATPase
LKDLATLFEKTEAVQSAIGKVIMGKRNIVELLLVALYAGGHVLIEDMPGTGKTMLSKALARCLNCSFQRIQFTPDLLPSDVTGYNYFDQKEQTFKFRPGPVMNHIVLADEINRAIPRTQSSLLECMGEAQVTLEGVTRKLPRPFIVLATQNPIEQEGTFPLPEAQLDRFLIWVKVGYPNSAEEDEMLLAYSNSDPLAELEPILEPKEVEEFKELCRQVKVEQSVRHYLLNICRATREHKAVLVGASPRATLGLMYAARALAAVRNRQYVSPDDVKYLAKSILGHRLVLKPQERMHGLSGQAVIEEVLANSQVPIQGEAVFNA